MFVAFLPNLLIRSSIFHSGEDRTPPCGVPLWAPWTIEAVPQSDNTRLQPRRLFIQWMMAGWVEDCCCYSGYIIEFSRVVHKYSKCIFLVVKGFPNRRYQGVQRSFYWLSRTVGVLFFRYESSHIVSDVKSSNISSVAGIIPLIPVQNLCVDRYISYLLCQLTLHLFQIYGKTLISLFTKRILSATFWIIGVLLSFLQFRSCLRK